MSSGAAIGGGIGGIAGGTYAGNRAASAQRNAANEAKNRLNASKNEALGRLDPYSNYGQQALAPLSALLYGKTFDTQTGDFTGDVPESERFNAFQQSPGYQYQLDQGLKAIQRQNAATGTLLGGNTLKELQGYGNDLANQDFNQYINTLMGQANIGQQADTNAANVITGMGSQIAGYDYAGGMGNAQRYANLSNALFQVGGMGAQSMLSGGGNRSGGVGGGGNSGGGGTYNSSFFNNAGGSSMGGATSLFGGA